MTDWIEAMRRRHSVRRYSSSPLSAEQIERLRSAVASVVALDADVPVQLLLVPFSDIGKRRSVAWLPIYNAAPWYLVVACTDVPRRMEEAGFRAEQVVLAATALGLDTCWVAGTFDPAAIASTAGLPKDDVLAISPIGAGERGALQVITSALARPVAARAGRRKPMGEFVFADRWAQPAGPGRVPPPIWQAIEMARLAPSWANTQPWAFLIAEDVLWAFADGKPQRGNSLPGKPYSRLDTGIAMAHIHLAMKQAGCSPAWRLPAEPPDGSLAVPTNYAPIAWLALP